MNPQFLPYMSALTFAALAIAASVLTPRDVLTPVLTLIGTLAGYVLAKQDTTFKKSS